MFQMFLSEQPEDRHLSSLKRLKNNNYSFSLEWKEILHLFMASSLTEAALVIT